MADKDTMRRVDMKKEIGNYSEIHQHYIKKGKTYSSSVQEALRFTLQDGKIHGN